jgi:hypothetical protein
MRANDFTTESAVDELKNKLPSLKNTSYDTIDELMQKISRRYKLTGKKLHDLFVHKYGHTPDTWIKKIKNRLSEYSDENMAEGIGDQGNFAGDTPINIGGQTVELLNVGDIVSYLGQKSKIVAQSKDRKYSRITIASDFGGTTKDVRTSDLKRLGKNVAEDWQKVNKRDKTDGMSKKAVKAYRRENPGSKLKTAVTTKPSKLKKGSKSAKRRKSFCARMSGMKKSRASAKTKRDPNSPINKALRRWNCESVEQMQELIMIAEQQINEAKNWKQQAAIAIAKKNEVSESVDGRDEVQQIKDFIKWSMKTLNVKNKPKFTLSKNTEQAQAGHHTGVHSGDRIWVYIGNRNLIDIFRTIFHELVHQRQSELNMIKDGDSYPGSPIEAVADVMAGKYIKIYGKEHPEIFQ